MLDCVWKGVKSYGICVPGMLTMHCVLAIEIFYHRELIFALHENHDILAGVMYDMFAGSDNLKNTGRDLKKRDLIDDHQEKLTEGQIIKELRKTSHLWKVERAVEEARVNNTVIVTSLTSGYLKLFHNHIKSMERVNPVLKNMLIVYAEDMQTYFTLRKSFRHTRLIPPSSFNDKHSGEFTPFSSVRNKLLSVRTERYIDLLSTGVTIFYLDVDFVWLSNPLPFIHNYNPHVDVLLISDSPAIKPETQAGNVTGIISLLPDFLCSCFLFIRPTESSGLLMKKWMQNMDMSSDDVNDQATLDQAIRYLAKRGKVKIEVLPAERFPSGLVYWHHRHKYERILDPFIVHANYLFNVDDKLKYLKRDCLLLTDL